MKLYGRDWTRRELEARVGRIEQIGGLRRVQLTEGREAGVEEIQVRTGAGLSYYVLPSRGLDIGLVEFGGVPLSWLSPNGEVHPAFYDARGLGWLRTLAGWFACDRWGRGTGPARARPSYPSPPGGC